MVQMGQATGDSEIMARKYTKVLEVMKAKGGRVELTDPDLNQVLGRLMYKVSGYMSCIRRYAHLEVKAVRDGRKVVAYELVSLTAAPAAVETVDTPTETVESV